MEDIRTIARLERLDSSVNGNPRFRVFFTDGTQAVTKSDVGFVYAIENPEFRGPLRVTLTRAGRIETLTPVEDPS